MDFFSTVNFVFHPLVGPYVHHGLDEDSTASQAIIFETRVIDGQRQNKLHLADMFHDTCSIYF